MNLFKQRCFAFVIDVFVITYFVALLQQFFPVLGKGIDVLSLGLFAAKDLLFRGASLGKKIMKISVVDISGRPAKISKLILRNIPTYALIWLEFFQIKQGKIRVGDLLAETMVVHI